jgi:HK97 family phage portal protein
MGLWPARAKALVDAAKPTVTAAGPQIPSSPANVFQITTGRPLEVQGVWADRVSRQTAMSVPAVARGASLLVTTMAGLPLDRIDGDGKRVDLGWVEQPEPGRPRFATFTDLGYDLLFDGRGYLRINQRDSTNAPRPGGCEYVPLHRVGDIANSDGTTTISIDGYVQDPRDIIGFTGWHEGILVHGARIIRTAIALEAAARRYADNPLPLQILTNTSGYELNDTEIDTLLEDYKRARNTEGVAYANSGIKPEPVGWDAGQLQLVEARQFTATQVANLVGVPAHWIAGAAASSGGSLTYSNVGQENRAGVDYGLKPLTRAIESRLSLSDVNGQAWTSQVTPRGTTVRFNLDGLLRGNPLERAQLYAQLIPLGVLTVDEARAMEDLAPTGKAQA